MISTANWNDGGTGSSATRTTCWSSSGPPEPGAGAWQASSASSPASSNWWSTSTRAAWSGQTIVRSSYSPFGGTSCVGPGRPTKTSSNASGVSPGAVGVYRWLTGSTSSPSTYGDGWAISVSRSITARFRNSTSGCADGCASATGNSGGGPAPGYATCWHWIRAGITLS